MTGRIKRMTGAVGLAAVLAAAGWTAGGLRAEETSPPAASAQPATPPGGQPELNFDVPETEVDMKPTELGVRFTPGMANAIGRQLSRQMKSHYKLSEDQESRAQEIIAKNLMKLAQKAQKNGRESIELLIENMIANNGTFTKEAGQQWAKVTRPILDELKEFSMTTAAQIGRTMDLGQRLKLTAEMTAFSAGLVTFENRLKKWEAGEVPNDANPFMDREETETSEPAPPGEGDEVRRARRSAERRMRWETNVEDRWSEYVDAAIEYYGLNEAQTTAARAILKESLDRARTIKSKEWADRMRRNRMTLQLTYNLSKEVRNGPWVWQLDREYEELLKPLQDLGRDLRTRIDELAETPQREKAGEQVRRELSEAGLSMPPA